MENNINNIYNTVNNNEKDNEEKISFITKDKLEEFIKTNKSKNRFYITIYLFLYLVTVILITIKLYFSATNFNLISNLSQGAILLQEIKSDLYTGSLIILSQCLRNKKADFPTELNSFESKMKSKSKDLIKHLSIFEKHILQIKAHIFVANVINILYENMQIFHLDSDWSKKIDESYLLKEINYFSYALNEQSSKNYNEIKCNLENNFYRLYFNSSEEIYAINKSPSFNQKFIYYTFMNIFNGFKPKISKMVDELIGGQLKTTESYYKKIFILHCILAFILILNQIFILLKYKSDCKFIKQNFTFLYHYERNEIQLEFEIHYLEIAAKEFNINNLIILENIKKYNYYYLYLLRSNDSNELLLNNNIENINNINNININNNINKKKNNNNDQNLTSKSKRFSKKFNTNIFNFKDIKRDLEQKSISEKILNNSLNNSSIIHILNRNNNNELNKLKDDKNTKKNQTSIIKPKSKSKGKNSKKNLNKNQLNKGKKNEINNIINEEEEEIMKDNKQSLDLLKSNNNLIPYTIIISIYSSFFTLILFLLVILINIINEFDKNKFWEYSINLSMNYIERIPKIIELGLSTYITVILGNFNHTNYLSKEEYKKNQTLSIQYFSKMKNYDNSELIPNYIEDSYFSNILYDYLKIKKNIEFCENDNYIKNYFIETKKWANKLNEQNHFCINACLGGFLFFYKDVTQLDIYFEIINRMALSCMEENEKINENGLNLEIDFILHEIIYLYVDFTQIMKTNITEARYNFYNNENFKRILRDMSIPCEIAIATFYTSVLNDIKELGDSISYFELLFIIIIYAIDLLFLLFLVIMIYFNEIDKQILIIISKILKKK